MLFSLLSGSFTESDLIELFVCLLIILLVLPLHECAHAWAAYKLGDDTASLQGRMTLNPFAHLDPLGSLCMLVAGFGWAKPVPIDPTRFSRKHSMRFGIAITAMAGPVSNLLAALLGTIGLRFFQLSDMYGTWLTYFLENGDTGSYRTAWIIYMMLSTFVRINIGLAVFNLLPIPPLDGSRMVSYFTGAKIERWFSRNAQVVQIVFLLLLATGILRVPIDFIAELVAGLLNLMTAWIPRLFG